MRPKITLCIDESAIYLENDGGRSARWIIGGFRQSRDWARNVFGRRKSTYRESLEIWLSEDDAQLLFWSFPKQFDILILNGS